MPSDRPDRSNLLRQRLEMLLVPPHLLPGARIPSLRQLAAKLQVSHVLIVKLMRQLEVEGVVVAGSSRIRFTRPAAAAEQPTRLPSGTVVVISDGITRPDERLHFNLLHELLLATSQAVQAAGMQTLVVQEPKTPAEAAQLTCLAPDAWISLAMYGPMQPELYEYLHRSALSGVPVAAIGETFSHAQLANFAGMTVSSDHSNGAAQLVEWLARRGRRQLLMLWSDSTHPGLNLQWVTERQAGLDSAAARFGLAAVRQWILPDSLRSGRIHRDFDHYTNQILGALHRDALGGAALPDGLCTITDGVALSAVAACALLGRDADVCGYDHYFDCVNERGFAPGPPAATIDKNGFVTGRLLVDQIRGTQRERRLLAPPRLVVPGSATP